MTFVQTTDTYSAPTRRVRATRYKASRSRGKYTPSPTDFVASYYAVLRRWRSETTVISDPRELFEHPSFKALVENAHASLPLMLSDLRVTPSNLVYVLEEAFGVTPYAKSSEGDLRAMTDAWLAWGERNASPR